MTEEKIDETSEQTAEETSTKPSRAELLEEEGEIAADYLEELLDLADIDGDIDIDVADGRAQLSIVCEDDEDSNLKTLVGKEGRTLGALQELSRLTVQTQTGQRSWLMLDIDGYRNSRRDELDQEGESCLRRGQGRRRGVRLQTDEQLRTQDHSRPGGTCRSGVGIRGRRRRSSCRRPARR